MNFLQIGILNVLFLLVVKEVHGGSFSIINSKVFRIDTEETVIVNLHGYGSTGVTVVCTLWDFPHRREEFSQVTKHGNSGEPISFGVKITKDNFPGARTLDGKRFEMKFRIQFDGNRYATLNKNVRVSVTGESDYIFIQTNRPIYRPGEKVFIRVIPLNLEMLPITDIPIEVIVQTPDKVGVWKRSVLVSTDNFLDATYYLPDDPPLGKWFVKAKINNTFHSSTSSTAFLVDKYVLPMYDVTLELDKSYLKPGEDIKGNITAMYSYGEPVVGIYAFVASVVLPGSNRKIDFYKRPSSIFKRALKMTASDKGFKSFTIRTNLVANLTGRTWEELVQERATVSVKASVMGSAEGVFESDVKENILITNSPYFLDLSHTSHYFIPSTTHTFKVIVRDVVLKKPVPGVPVAVTDDEIETRRATTNQNGHATIVIDVPPSRSGFMVTVATEDPNLENENQAKVAYVLKKIKTYNYLRLSAPGTASVGEDIHIRFDTRGATPSDMYYLVQARGLILLSDKIRISNRGGEVSQKLSITRKMSPSIRVVAYYLQANEIISDSIWIDVEDACISKELDISLSSPTVLPGGGIHIHLEGQELASIGLSAVDRAAYFLNDEDRLDRDQMFKKMNSFDNGCLLSGGSTGLNVFEDAGLTITPRYRQRANQVNRDCSQEKQEEGKRRKKRAIKRYGFDLDALRLRCSKDGRAWKILEDTCEDRLRRVKKWEVDRLPSRLAFNGLCRLAFMAGCRKGVILQRRAKILRRHARTSGQGIDVDYMSMGQVRSRFLESWMWKSVKLDSSGSEIVETNAPDTITTHDIDAISVHSTEGFCVAKAAELKVFKTLFIKLFLPYSIKVLEQVQIRAAVFNYHKRQDKTISLKLWGDSALCSQHTPGEWADVATVTVPSQSSKSFSFTFVPLKVPGDEKVTIQLKAVDSTGVTVDAIAKKLKIEEAGTQEELSGSTVIDPALSDRNQEFRFHFPDENVLPETKKCSIYGHMSFLGPIIEFDRVGETPKNLAGSLQIPDGCGEQNILKVGPNVFAFNYLKVRRDPTAAAEAKIQTFIKNGYTIELGHRYNNIWSVYSSSSPTIWLNAFVDKTFLHAREVWPDIKMGPICTSIGWILDYQESDGRFSEPQHARFYKIHVSIGGDVSLTSYVVMALSETGFNCPNLAEGRLNQTLIRAVGYLRRHVHDDFIVPYTSALLSYSLALMDARDSSTTTINARLLQMKKESRDGIYWESSSDSVNDIDLPPWYDYKVETIDIETTAYALLAQVTIAEKTASMKSGIERKQELEMINKIARWLAIQRNDRGGWRTSQTTVTAIQALTKYETWFETLEAPPRNPRLNMLLTSPGNRSWSQSFNLDESHEFYRKELEIPANILETSNTINVQLQSGKGRGSLSYRCTYRMSKDSEVCHFKIVAETSLIGLRGENGLEEAEPGRGKNVIKLKIFVEKPTAGDSSMAIIDVGLISGFRPIEDSLKELTIADRVDGIIDRYEVTDQNVLLYVEKIPSTLGEDLPLKIAFNLQQYVEVKHPNPAQIKVYDYYNPGISCDKFYTVPNGIPTIKFNCLPSSVDNNEERQCKCLAGGCPTCRTREEQLTKSCGKKYRCNNACNFPEPKCFNMHKNVCNRNFGYVVEIESIDNTSMLGFMKIHTHVKEIFRTLNDNGLKAEQDRVFILRTKCFEACKDNTLKSLENDDYFSPGRQYLFMGKKPEGSKRSDGSSSVRYYLDEEAVIERALSTDKCARFEKKREACRSSRTEKCRKIQRLLKICDNQTNMKIALNQGCDI